MLSSAAAKICVRLTNCSALFVSVSNSLRVRGLSGTIHLAFLRLFNFNGTPEHILSRMLDLRRYDREHGVETAGLIETAQLKFDSASKAHGTRYGGATPWLFRDTLDRIPIDHKNYTFIDIGSGKGAALFQASDYPFKAIVGVEYAPELHAAALRNIASFRSTTQRCRNITAICEDGGAYQYPDGPWLLFFNSPFGVPIWKRVAENIERSPRGSQKSWLIYMNHGWDAEAAEFVEGLGFLKLMYRGDTVLIFEFV